jgi:hypothetical protein
MTLFESILQEMAYFKPTKAVELFFYWFPNITGVQYLAYWQNIKQLGQEQLAKQDTGKSFY